MNEPDPQVSACSKSFRDDLGGTRCRPPETASSSSLLPEVPGGWATSEILIGDHSFHLQLPASPDEFLDDPLVQQANRQSDYMPYWAYLWPAAQQMAKLVLNESWPPGTPALELGSGIGLVGIAGLVGGLRVTFSDHDETSLMAATLNARHNNVESDAAALLDWREPQAAALRNRFPVILGCDVLYEVSLHEPLLNVLDWFLDDKGICWLGDPGRTTLQQFCTLARERNYVVEFRDENGKPRAADDRIQPLFHLVILHRRESHNMPDGK